MSQSVDPNQATQDFDARGAAKVVEKQPTLIVLEGPREGQVFVLDEGDTLLGRSEECEIQILHDVVSRKHLRFTCGNICSVRDLESRNGSDVNGSRIIEHQLHEGDVITIGGTVVLKFSRASELEARFWERQNESITKDPLTGAHNRRALMSQANSEWAFAKRHQRPLSMLMIDIDHFKRVNDSKGHAYGDQVLKTVADAIQGALRCEDFVARFGGEEFLALLRETDSSEAFASAERVRKAVLELEEDPQISVSIGVSTTNTNILDVDMLVRCADGALYQAKKKGRNCSQVFEGSAKTEPLSRR